MKLETAINRCFDKCNLIGSDVDIFKEMMGYKAIRECEEKWDEIYDQIAERLGFFYMCKKDIGNNVYF